MCLYWAHISTVSCADVTFTNSFFFSFAEHSMFICLWFSLNSLAFDNHAHIRLLILKCITLNIHTHLSRTGTPLGRTGVFHKQLGSQNSIECNSLSLYKKVSCVNKHFWRLKWKRERERDRISLWYEYLMELAWFCYKLNWKTYGSIASCPVVSATKGRTRSLLSFALKSEIWNVKTNEFSVTHNVAWIY